MTTIVRYPLTIYLFDFMLFQVLPNFPTDNPSLEMTPSADTIEKDRKPIAISALSEAAPPLPKTPSPDFASKVDPKSTSKASPIQSPVNEHSHKSSFESLPPVNENITNGTQDNAIPEIKSNSKPEKIADTTEVLI